MCVCCWARLTDNTVVAGQNVRLFVLYIMVHVIDSESVFISYDSLMLVTQRNAFP